MGIVKQIIEERELGFWDHLEVLRWMLFRVICAWVILSVAFFIIMPDFFDKIILAPCYNDFVFYDFLRYIGQTFHLNDPFFTQDGFEVKLQNINLASQFFTHITTSFLMAVVVTAPYLVYETWRFVRPALYPNEMKGVRKAFSLGTFFFFLGVAVGYFMIFPLALRFLATYQLSAAIENEISLTSYIDNFMMLVLMMGVAFELPLVTWLLSLIGLVSRSFLREYRRHAFLIIVIFAAVITPTGDPFTLSAVSLPLYLLYELSIFMVKDKKEDEDEDEDDEAEDDKEETGKKEETAEGKENKLIGQKNADQKALPAKEQETPVDEESKDSDQSDENVNPDDLNTSEKTSVGEEDNTDSPEGATEEQTSAAAPSESEYEEEYYLENDELKVRQVSKETTSPVAVSEEVAPYEKLYVRPEDQFVDAGDDMFGYGFTDTPPLNPYAPIKEPVEPIVKPTAIDGMFHGEDFLESVKAEAQIARETADAAAKAAQQAANEALEAAKKAAKAAEEAVKKAEEVAKEAARRAEEVAKMKPLIDVSQIRYDIDRLHLLDGEKL